MRTFTLAAALILVIPCLVRATAQYPEKLLYEGKEWPLRSTPLEGYLAKHPNAVVTGGVSSTALWRGYVGTWSITDEKLHLVKIEQEHVVHKEKDSIDLEWREFPLEKLFPKKKSPILADWYTGLLSVPDGKLLAYVHMGFESTFEKEMLFLVEKGEVKKTATINNLDADPYTSVRDRRWVAVGDPPKDAGEWIDARLLQTAAADGAIKGGKVVKTRGVVFEDTDDDGKVVGHLLYVPHTRETQLVVIKLGKLTPNLASVTGQHAEVEGVISRDKGEVKMTVQSTRALKHGETMHAPSLKDALEKMEEGERAKVVRMKVEEE